MGKVGKIEEAWSPFRAYATKNRRRILSLPDFLALCSLVLLGLFLYWRAKGLPEYHWNWHLLGEFMAHRGKDGQWESGLLLRGLFTTLRVGLWTFALSLFAGGIIGSIAARKAWLSGYFCQIYINLARSTPPLVLLFCVYFFAGNILPVGSLEDWLRQTAPWIKKLFGDFFAQPGQLDRMIAAVLALGCYQGAYVAEIVRGGIESVPQGQWDAAYALGFLRRDALLLVIVPQALRLMLPPLVSQAITTFKETALVSLISMPDLTFQSLEIMSISGMTFEVWISAGILYLFIGAVCALLGWMLEKKYHFHY